MKPLRKHTKGRFAARLAERRYRKVDTFHLGALVILYVQCGHCCEHLHFPEGGFFFPL